MFIAALGGTPLIKPKANDVRDDSPAAFVRSVHQLVAALSHGSAAIAPDTINKNSRASYFDDCKRLIALALPKEAENRVWRFSSDRMMLLAMPDLFAIKRTDISECLAKNLREKIALHLSLVHLGQAAR